MAEVTTSKLINLGQLSAELGAELSLREEGGLRVVLADTVAQATLDAAITAHVAVDEAGNATTLRSQAETALGGNRTFLALGTPTNAQILAQVRALTRQNNGLIRLVLNRLDGTD